MTLFLLSLGDKLTTSTFKLTFMQITSEQSEWNETANLVQLFSLYLCNGICKLVEILYLAYPEQVSMKNYFKKAVF